MLIGSDKLFLQGETEAPRLNDKKSGKNGQEGGFDRILLASQVKKGASGAVSAKGQVEEAPEEGEKKDPAVSPEALLLCVEDGLSLSSRLTMPTFAREGLFADPAKALSSLEVPGQGGEASMPGAEGQPIPIPVNSERPPESPGAAEPMFDFGSLGASVIPAGKFGGGDFPQTEPESPEGVEIPNKGVSPLGGVPDGVSMIADLADFVDGEENLQMDLDYVPSMGADAGRQADSEILTPEEAEFVSQKAYFAMAVAPGSKDRQTERESALMRRLTGVADGAVDLADLAVGEPEEIDQFPQAAGEVTIDKIPVRDKTMTGRLFSPGMAPELSVGTGAGGDGKASSAEDVVRVDPELEVRDFSFGTKNLGLDQRLSSIVKDVLDDFSSVGSLGGSDYRSLLSTSPGLPASEILPQRGSEGLSHGILNVIRFLQSNGEARAQIVVEPPSLGRIEVAVHAVPGGNLEASFQVENVAVRDMIKSQLPLLQDLLAQVGISVSEMSVDVRSGDGQSQQWEGGKNGKRRQYVSGEIEEIGDAIPTARVDLEQGLLLWIA